MIASHKEEDHMSMFFQPLTVEEALTCLAKENTMACAGGTNLYVDRKHGKFLDKDYASHLLFLLPALIPAVYPG